MSDFYFKLRLLQNVERILKNQEQMMATQQELASSLNTLTATVNKIGEETTSLLADLANLRAVMEAGGPTTPEVDAALAALEARANAVDALVPDLPPPPTP